MLVTLFLLIGLVGPVMAQGAHGLGPAGSSDNAASPREPAKRYPQKIRAGDLRDRLVLEPSFRLGVLGRVDGIARDAGGHLLLVVRYGGALGLGTRLIAVPLDTAGAMGPYVQIIDIAPSQLAALPTLDAASLSKLADGDIVSIGLGMKQR